MKNTDKTRPKQGLGQKKPKVQPREKKQSLEKRQRPEMALQASEEKFRRLFETAQDGILLLDAEMGVINEANPFIEELLGYSRAELIGKELWEIGPFKDISTSRDAFLELQKKKYIRYEDLPLETKDGRHCNVEFVSNVYRVGSQKVIQCNIRDITERKRIEVALQENEKKFRTLITQSPEGIFLVDLSGNFLTVNKAMCEALGFSEEEFLSMNIWDIIPEQYVDQHKKRLTRILHGERLDESSEYTVRGKDGKTHYIEVQSAPYYSEKEIVGFQGIAHDITERKQAEEALRTSEAQLSNAMEIARLGYWEYDVASDLFTFDDHFYSIFRTTAEREGGYKMPSARYAERFVHPDDMPLVGLEIQKALETTDPHYSRQLEHRMIYADGETGHIAVRFFVVKDDQGRTVKTYGANQDITERKQAEEEYKTILHTAMDGFLITDMQGRFLDVNDAYCRLTGYSRDEMLTMRVPDIEMVEGPEETARHFKRIMEFGRDRFETRHRCKDGRSVDVEVSVNYIDSGGGRLFTFIRDITERKRAEDRLAAERNLLNTLIDNLPDNVFVKDGNSRIVIDNIAHRRLLGATTLEEVIGKTDFDFFTRDLADSYRTDEKEIIHSGKVMINREEPTVDADGKQRWLLTTKVPLRDRQGKITGIVGINRDITERKQAEEKLAQQTEELHRRNEELARLYRASGSLLSGVSLSLQELAQTIVGVVQREFGQANCSLLVIHRDLNELQRLAAAGPFADQVKYQNLSLDGPGLVPRAIRTSEVVNVGDVHSDPDYVQGWDAARSELTIPLKVGSNVIGVIDVQSSEPDAFSPDDERLMTIFAERAALALEHGRLYAQTESRMQQLIALRTVDMAISGSFDINLTLGVLLDQVTGQLGVHAADILIFNAAAQTFEFSCERGFRTQTLRHTRLKFGAGYAWRLVRERQVINIPDIQKGPDGLQRSPDLSGEQFVAYVGIPLIAKGQIKGILEIFHREPVKFDPEWYRFLELLAGQAAIAIDNAELFDNLQSSNSELSMAYDSTLEGWASALELRDNETEGHTRRATELTTRLAQAMGIKENDMMHIYRGALLHDIGKMGVPDSIVLKPGPLTEDEWVTMRKHPQYAYAMLSPISYLRLALDIPYCHHEKWDGTGYPRGLKGEQIPLAARIFAVVDVWDALTSDRPYRNAWPAETAIDFIREQAGKHFDPKVVEIFLREVKHA